MPKINITSQAKRDKLWKGIGICDGKSVYGDEGPEFACPCHVNKNTDYQEYHERYKIKKHMEDWIESGGLMDLLMRDMLCIELKDCRYELNNLQIIVLMDAYGFI